MKGWLSFPQFHSAVVVLLVSSGLALGSSQKSPTLEQSFQIRSGGTVEVNNSNGGVQIQTWDENYVHVKAEKVNPPGQPVFFSDIAFAASELTVVIECHPADPQARINLTVYAPRNCQVQIGNGSQPAQNRQPASISQPQPAYPPGASQQLPPRGWGSSGRIAGSNDKGYDQQNEGWGPIQREGDRKNSSEGSLGVGVRVIPPLGTDTDSSPDRRRRTSDRDPFAVFDQDPFFNDDRDVSSKSGRSSRSSTDRGGMSPDRERSPRRRSEPVLTSRDEEARAGADSASPDVISGASNRPNDDMLTLQGELVNLNVSVRDRSGKAVAGLTQSGFQVYEDDVLQQIAFFSPTSAPFNLVLVLDLSGSMREKLDVLKGAAIRFIDTLNPQDRVAVVAFTHQARLISPLTADRTLLRERIQQMQSDKGRTALYEALWQVATEILTNDAGQRNAIVVLSDGVDNSISEFNVVPTVVSFEDLLNRIEESDVIMYPIYLDTEQEVVYKYLQESPEAYKLARERLQTLADTTGGVMYHAERLEDLDATYEQVAADLRAVYTLAYYPNNTRRDGSWRRIRIKVKGKNAAVRTRAGYYAR